MNPHLDAWEARCATLWGELDAMDPAAFVEQVDALAGELPDGSPVALFEQACARDSTGHSHLSVPRHRSLARHALELVPTR